MSPSSLKVTFRQLRAGAALSLPQVLVMEFRLSQTCLVSERLLLGVARPPQKVVTSPCLVSCLLQRSWDFSEGVRAGESGTRLR